jgi:coatomer protein complex subunit alpha (xenin)
MLDSSSRSASLSSSNSDTGIIKTLEQPVYLTRIKGKIVHCIDRSGKPRTIEIDPTEYRFKPEHHRVPPEEGLRRDRSSLRAGRDDEV